MFATVSDPGSARDADLVAVDEIVTITMHGHYIVISPAGELDAMRTQVLVDALNAAVVSGSVVTLSAGTEPDLADLHLDAGDGAGHSHGGELSPVSAEVVLAGVIRVPVGDVMWTVDVNGGRFLRSDRALDVRFLVGADWTPYSAMWFASSMIVAATRSGSYVLGRRGGASADRDASPHAHSLSA